MTMAINMTIHMGTCVDTDNVTKKRDRMTSVASIGGEAEEKKALRTRWDEMSYYYYYCCHTILYCCWTSAAAAVTAAMLRWN